MPLNAVVSDLTGDGYLNYSLEYSGRSKPVRQLMIINWTATIKSEKLGQNSSIWKIDFSLTYIDFVIIRLGFIVTRTFYELGVVRGPISPPKFE